MLAFVSLSLSLEPAPSQNHFHRLFPQFCSRSSARGLQRGSLERVGGRGGAGEFPGDHGAVVDPRPVESDLK